MMRQKLGTIEDILEIILNFFVVLCLETAVDASFGRMLTPLFWLCLPLLPALFFYGLRRCVKNLPLFLVLHLAAFVLLLGAAEKSPFPVLWRFVFVVIGVIYGFCSVKIRVTRQTDEEGEIPFQLAGGIAAGCFLICSYMKEDAGCGRMIWISFLWIFLFLLRKYLENFLHYVDINQRTAGAMPEKSIFKTGMLTVAVCSGCMVLILIICARTPLISMLSALVGKCGRFLLQLLFTFLMLFARGEGETGFMEEPEREILPPEPGSMESSAWLLFLDQLLRLTITFALIAALIWAIVLLIRSIIRGFYGRTGEVRELVREGFTEEEQRLSGNPKKREKRLPFWGGTMQQRLRRTFLKTVQESCPKENGLPAMTAREIAALAAERQQKAADAVTDSRQNTAGTVTDGQEKWNRLAGLYEKARYTEETINSEDVRTAGKLSREILHNIK